MTSLSNLSSTITHADSWEHNVNDRLGAYEPPDVAIFYVDGMDALKDGSLSDIFGALRYSLLSSLCFSNRFR